MSEPTASPWAQLAAIWEDLFPLRQPRVDLALALAPDGTRTLDAGCATGSLVRTLASHGRLAHGLDLEPAFLDAARVRAEGLAVTWHLADLLGVAGAVGGARFRLVTCLGQTLPHLLEEDQWLDFFRQVHGILDPGGHLAIQVVNDGGAEIGRTRELPVLRTPMGTLERRRTVDSETLATFETRFTPEAGEPVSSRVRHRRMRPEAAAHLLREAGLLPGPPRADEAGTAFLETSPGWILVARKA
jgi:SAM-dependent methyltransferase